MIQYQTHKRQQIVTEGCNGKEVEEVTFVFIKKEEVTILF